MNDPREAGAAHDAALTDYFDELLDAGLSPGQAPDLIQDQGPDSAREADAGGIRVAAGCIDAGDERHYLFELAGLTLALPAARISAEYQPALPVMSAADASPQRAQLPAGGDCRLLDLAPLVLSGSPTLQERAAKLEPSASLVLDHGWGFQLGAPGELRMLDLDQVQWRGPHSRRSWLAGTWAARRLILLDLDGLAAFLA